MNHRTLENRTANRTAAARVLSRAAELLQLTGPEHGPERASRDVAAGIMADAAELVQWLLEVATPAQAAGLIEHWASDVLAHDAWTTVEGYLDSATITLATGEHEVALRPVAGHDNRWTVTVDGTGDGWAHTEDGEATVTAGGHMATATGPNALRHAALRLSLCHAVEAHS